MRRRRCLGPHHYPRCRRRAATGRGAVVSPPSDAPLCVRPEFAGRAVQHGVDVLVSVSGAETLAEVDAFVDDDAVRDVGPLLQLEQADHENGRFHWIELFEGAVDQRLERSADRLAALYALGEQLSEIFEVGARRGLVLEELTLDLGDRLVCELPLVKGLHRELAGDGARA